MLRHAALTLLRAAQFYLLDLYLKFIDKLFCIPSCDAVDCFVASQIGYPGWTPTKANHLTTPERKKNTGIRIRGR